MHIVVAEVVDGNCFGARRCGPARAAGIYFQACPLEKGQRFRKPLHNGLSQQPGGSVDGVGWRFQSFTINDLEMVAQICPRWNPLTSWMRQIEDFQTAA